MAIAKFLGKHWRYVVLTSLLLVGAAMLYVQDRGRQAPMRAEDNARQRSEAVNAKMEENARLRKESVNLNVALTPEPIDGPPLNSPQKSPGDFELIALARHVTQDSSEIASITALGVKGLAEIPNADKLDRMKFLVTALAVLDKAQKDAGFRKKFNVVNGKYNYNQVASAVVLHAAGKMPLE